MKSKRVWHRPADHHSAHQLLEIATEQDDSSRPRKKAAANSHARCWQMVARTMNDREVGIRSACRITADEDRSPVAE
jgi:hypothetical protein